MTKVHILVATSRQHTPGDDATIAAAREHLDGLWTTPAMEQYSDAILYVAPGSDESVWQAAIEKAVGGDMLLVGNPVHALHSLGQFCFWQLRQAIARRGAK